MEHPNGQVWPKKRRAIFLTSDLMKPIEGQRGHQAPLLSEIFPLFFAAFATGRGGSSCLSRLSACDMSDLSHCRAPSCLLAKLTKENSHQTLLIIIETFNTVNKSICCGPQQDREYPCSLYFNTVCPLHPWVANIPLAFHISKLEKLFTGPPQFLNSAGQILTAGSATLCIVRTLSVIL